MLSIIRTDALDQDFVALVSLLDQELTIIDGDDHSFYDQFNKIDNIKNAVVAYLDGVPVGCGAFKPFDPLTAEIKRMYVLKSARGKRIASGILTELENWARETGFERFILETGIRQADAVALYTRMNYAVIPNYEPYKDVENSVCFAKKA